MQFDSSSGKAVSSRLTSIDVEAAEVRYSEDLDSDGFIGSGSGAWWQDSLFDEQWALDTIEAGEVFGLWNSADEGVDLDSGQNIIAVIDTGINYYHEDIENQMWLNIDEVPGNGLDDDNNGYVDDVYGYDFVNNDSDPMDDHGHGTHCAGIAAADANSVGIVGGNPAARVMALKFLNERGSGYLTDMLEAVEYALENGAMVLSNSYGYGADTIDSYTALAAAMADQYGAVFVAAAGNDRRNNDAFAHYPSNAPNASVVAVASSDQRDDRSHFSNWGEISVDLYAPGSDILSLDYSNQAGIIK